MKQILNAAPLALALLAAALAAPALAHEQEALSPMAPEMSLDAQARSMVDNDLMTVVMTVEVEGPKVQDLSQKALAAMQKATARAKEKPGIEVHVGSVNTFPVYGPKGKTSNWHVRGDVTLSGTSTAALGLLASELTNDMQITSVNFSLSRAKRDSEEGKLIVEAANAFKHKAQAMATALGFKSYVIKMVGLSQDPGNVTQPPQPMMMGMRAGGSEAAAVPVPTEGGKTEVVLNLNGSVELK